MTQFDVLLRNGRVVDGSGAPAYAASVAVRDGRIAEIGELNGAQAEREIDVGGHVIAPGFVDIHSRTRSTAPSWGGCTSSARRGTGSIRS